MDRQEAPAPPTDLDSIEDAARIATHYLGSSRIVVMTPEEALRLVAELRTARKARDELQALHSDLHDYDLTAASANRLRRILTTWDEQAVEGGGAR